jgi:GNAT superfamily N-acetyltransferase
VFRLRAVVWRSLSNDSQFYGDEWSDAFDLSALHWIARVDGVLAASARMNIHSDLQNIPDAHFFLDHVSDLVTPIASISRLVVHSHFRGLGISTKLDSLRIGTARDLGCGTVTGIASKWSGIERLQALEEIGFRPSAPLYSLRDWDWDWITPLILQL